MLAAAIFGLGSSTKDLKPFQKDSHAEWLIGLPGSSSEADAILIFGGDGTVHRHLGSLMRLGLPVLVVPRGSGNDFARALGLRSVRDSLAVWRRFASGDGKVRTIDLGMIWPVLGQPLGLRPSDNRSLVGTLRLRSGQATEAAPFPESRNLKLEAENAKYFCCVAGVGLDAEIARRANQLPRWLRGHGGYVLSLPPALLRFAPLRMNLQVADAPGSQTFVSHSHKPTVLVAFANTPVYGGGMRIAPQAQMDDGQLDICLVSDVDKFKLFCLFPTVYFGRHLSIPGVEYFHAERLRLETEKPLEVYADGEFVCQTPVEVSAVKGALQVIV